MKLELFAENWPESVIRCKGMMWFSDEDEMSYILETSGRQIQAAAAGIWLAACSKEEQEEVLAQEPKLQAEWNEEVGDRMVKICIIGQKLNKEEICKDLDSLLD